MEKVNGEGYWRLLLDNVTEGLEYLYQLDNGQLLPDPASHFQPHGVFGPSAVVDHQTFTWRAADWKGRSLKDTIFYELHVGTFTQEGTFKAASSRIKELVELGVNAVELMPIAQFPGSRNWGYDTAFIYAVQNSYGGPDDLRRFVDECHLQGVAVIFDVVYNHAGPEGNFLNQFGPYFLTRKMTDWGPMANLDGPLNGPVREYFLQNTCHWIKNYHADGLRLDAVLSMIDSSPKHFLAELTETAQKCSKTFKRKMWLIAESGYNQPKVLLPRKHGGFEFDAQWLDDFQHALFSVLTGEREGYYGNYGAMEHLEEVMVESYLHVGGGGLDKSFRRRRTDEHFLWISSSRLVTFSQNHDQIGNRLFSDRLIAIAGQEAAKVAAGLTLLSPYLPLLFMGEEYGETAPFNFFVDYASKELSGTIREGRMKEFAEFNWQGESLDPSDKRTFESSKLNWDLRYKGEGKKILAYYQTLIHLRQCLAKSGVTDRKKMNMRSNEADKILFIQRCQDNYANVVVANLSPEEQRFTFPFDGGKYIKIFDSADVAWAGPGFVLPIEVVKGSRQNIRSFNLAVFEKRYTKKRGSLKA